MAGPGFGTPKGAGSAGSAAWGASCAAAEARTRKTAAKDGMSGFIGGTISPGPGGGNVIHVEEGCCQAPPTHRRIRNRAPGFRDNAVGGDWPLAGRAGRAAGSGSQFAGLLPAQWNTSLRDGQRWSRAGLRQLLFGSPQGMRLVSGRYQCAGLPGCLGRHAGAGSFWHAFQPPFESIPDRSALPDGLQPRPPEAWSSIPPAVTT